MLFVYEEYLSFNWYFFLAYFFYLKKEKFIISVKIYHYYKTHIIYFFIKIFTSKQHIQY